MLKKKALAILQAAFFVAAVATTAVAFQPAPAEADTEEWCLRNCDGGRNFCGTFYDEEGNPVHCPRDLSNCI